LIVTRGPTIAAALAKRSQFPQFGGMGLAESRVGIGRPGGRKRPCTSAIFTSHPPVERPAEGRIGGTKPIPPVRGYAPVARLCPPDYRIAGEVQAIGGKWMKMGEKEVVTQKCVLGSAAPETWRAGIGSPPPNRVKGVIPRRLLPWTAFPGRFLPLALPISSQRGYSPIEKRAGGARPAPPGWESTPHQAYWPTK
jgi:hypothetical protein